MKRTLYYASLFLVFALALWALFGCTAQAQTKVVYTGYSYTNGVLSLNFSFPAELVTLLQKAGGLADAKAQADRLGAQAAEGLNNRISEAAETEKNQVKEFWDKKATAAQKTAFQTWRDTVGTFDREHPIIPVP